MPDRFVAYDGSKSNTFRRTPPRDRGPRTHEGYVYAWEDWPSLADNVFDQVLFMLPNGVGANVPLTDALRRLHLDRFRVESRQPADGSEMIVMLGSSNKGSGMKYRAVMTGKPDHILHEWEAKYAKQNERTLLHGKVKEVKRLEGVPYPARGSYHRVGIGAIEDLKYDFEATSVVPMGENERKLWLPPWPPATIVRDHANNQNFQTEARDGDF